MKMKAAYPEVFFVIFCYFLFCFGFFFHHLRVSFFFSCSELVEGLAKPFFGGFRSSAKSFNEKSLRYTLHSYSTNHTFSEQPNFILSVLAFFHTIAF